MLFLDIEDYRLFKSILEACLTIFFFFLYFHMVVQEPWKGSVLEVFRIETTDGSY